MLSRQKSLLLCDLPSNGEKIQAALCIYLNIKLDASKNYEEKCHRKGRARCLGTFKPRSEGSEGISKQVSRDCASGRGAANAGEPLHRGS
jgi:hypothetical protein